MLTEYNSPGEMEGSLKKRWFGDSFFDLFVWFDQSNTITSFQLCYNKSRDEHALTWKRPSSYYHQRVDDGENRPGKNKSTPVLLVDGSFDFRSTAKRFLDDSEDIDPEIAKFVHTKLLEFNRSTAAA